MKIFNYTIANKTIVELLHGVIVDMHLDELLDGVSTLFF